MTNELVAMYRKGAITADHLAVQCLHMIDLASPDLALSSLPHDILLRVLEFARQCEPGNMLTNYGPLPAED